MTSFFKHEAYCCRPIPIEKISVNIGQEGHSTKVQNREKITERITTDSRSFGKSSDLLSLIVRRGSNRNRDGFLVRKRRLPILLANDLSEYMKREKPKNHQKIF